MTYWSKAGSKRTEGAAENSRNLRECERSIHASAPSSSIAVASSPSDAIHCRAVETALPHQRAKSGQVAGPFTSRNRRVTSVVAAWVSIGLPDPTQLLGDVKQTRCPWL